MPEIPIKEALNKAYIKVRPERTAIERFKANFVTLLDTIKEKPGETEEFLKNMVSDFLKKTWYDPDYFINTAARFDLVIHIGKTATTPIGVIIEAKRPGNKSEMISKTNLNAKAMQELLLYYLRETIDNKNLELKHLIITNSLEWFVFHARDFYHCFSQNKELIKLYGDFKAGSLLEKDNAFFYSQIAAPYIKANEKNLNFTYFNIADFERIIRSQDKEADNKLISLYKLLSPAHLLKLSFANDSNSLNQNFYSELLYIMGLCEDKENGKKVIVRNKIGKRHDGSLIENAIFRLSTYDLTENELFEFALELTITWIDRILFLKLLESQQVQYQKGNPDYAFLNIGRVKSYSDLQTLFFDVLAKKPEERRENIKKRYGNVPYLNSSLFDMTSMEQSYFSISSLPEAEIDVHSGTVLKDAEGRKRTGVINALEYIFEFLDAYDFSSEGSEEIQEENKTLINASVLGLIFEKINGYRDGSYFTPGFITTYICREILRNVVVNKFNVTKGWTAANFEELQNYIDNIHIESIREANKIINSITICDPAVGSGHFLVSALNEIIAIKSDLGVLADSRGRKLKGYKVEVVNDELMVFDENRDFYVYNYRNEECRRIQETIFQEKRRIIENCLFGVDINSNSVKICRLRLWIELLKNAYYTEESKYTQLETLPNIDINIKCGNSLISRFDIDIDLKEELERNKLSVKEYQEAVYNYKNAVSREEKIKFDKLITEIKNNFRGGAEKHGKLSQRKYRLHAEMAAMTQQELFELSEKEKNRKKKRIQEITDEIELVERQIEDIKTNKIYDNAFEWRFEFPEILNDSGEFIGFDAVIGNPPYIQLQGELANMYSGIGYECFSRSGDIYQLFYECGYKILIKDGLLCFITSNKWMRTDYGEKTRYFFTKRTNPKILIDFAGQKIFEAATVDVNIILLEKKENKQETLGCIIKEECQDNMTDYIRQHGTTLEFSTSNSWVILNSIEKRIKEKIEQVGKPLKDWDISINYGIKTGCNEAFIIDKNKCDELIAKDSKSAEIIRPILRGRDIKRYGYEFANQYIIATFPSRKYNIDDYPSVRDYLLEFGKKRLEQSGKPGARKKTGHKWFETQDPIAYWDDFSKQKITWGNLNLKAAFTLAPENMFINAPATMIVPGDKYLLGVLNSKLADYYIRNLGVTRNGGYFEYKPMFINKMPIPIPNLEDRNIIESLVIEILELKGKGKDVSNFDTELTTYIYKLYSLTEKEREFINSL